MLEVAIHSYHVVEKIFPSCDSSSPVMIHFWLIREKIRIDSKFCLVFWDAWDHCINTDVMHSHQVCILYFSWSSHRELAQGMLIREIISLFICICFRQLYRMLFSHGPFLLAIPIESPCVGHVHVLYVRSAYRVSPRGARVKWNRADSYCCSSSYWFKIQIERACVVGVGTYRVSARYTFKLYRADSHWYFFLIQSSN